jgi:hypothetical protein|tara:strand:+ start:299 stop:562 length:264 start_codon:yes stop_codon:yes gene_type:complete
MTKPIIRSSTKLAYMFFDEVTLPTESFGVCETYFQVNLQISKDHSSDEVTLAEGVCCDCWDKGMGGSPTPQMIQKRKKSGKGKRALL